MKKFLLLMILLSVSLTSTVNGQYWEIQSPYIPVQQEYHNWCVHACIQMATMHTMQCVSVSRWLKMQGLDMDCCEFLFSESSPCIKNAAVSSAKLLDFVHVSARMLGQQSSLNDLIEGYCSKATSYVFMLIPHSKIGHAVFLLYADKQSDAHYNISFIDPESGRRVDTYTTIPLTIVY